MQIFFWSWHTLGWKEGRRCVLWVYVIWVEAGTLLAVGCVDLFLSGCVAFKGLWKRDSQGDAKQDAGFWGNKVLVKYNQTAAHAWMGRRVYDCRIFHWSEQHDSFFFFPNEATTIGLDNPCVLLGMGQLESTTTFPFPANNYETGVCAACTSWFPALDPNFTLIF